MESEYPKADPAALNVAVPCNITLFHLEMYRPELTSAEPEKVFTEQAARAAGRG